MLSTWTVFFLPQAISAANKFFGGSFKFFDNFNSPWIILVYGPILGVAVGLVGAGALGGAFWGMLIGLIFLVPWLGLAIGAISGAIAGKFSDIGIDDKFIKEVGATVEPGHSALFMLVEQMTDDRVLPELGKFHPTVLRTNLSTEDEAKLRAAFGAEE
jgi:uncharacterized membrane protein